MMTYLPSLVAVGSIVVLGIVLAGFKLPKGALAMFGCVIMPGGAMLLALVQAIPSVDSVGGVIAIVGSVGSAALYVGRKLTRIQTVLLTRGIEHEMLIYDYCARHNMEVGELPTRAAQTQAKSQSAGSIF